MSFDTFEKTRVQHLAKTRALQQKRIFTNWVNAQLELADQASFEEPFINGHFYNGFSVDSIESRLAMIFKEQSLYRVKDLYNDLSDGRVLLRLLEIFTGRKISLSRGTMRVHWLENVGKALDQMKQMNIHHENIGPIDIVDGNSHLILGLIWIFILNFQENLKLYVQWSYDGLNIFTGNLELWHARKLARLPFTRQLGSESPMEMKNALLRWCQLKTAVYPQIEIVNFTTSWSDGLAMCALIYRHCPDILDFEKLAAPNVSPIDRLSEAFNVAERTFRMPIIVSATDFIACSNDERCVIAVVATWYHRLNETRVFKKSANRLAVVLNRAVTAGRHMMAYIRDVYNLRKWMKTNLRFLEELSTFKDIQIISKKLNQWREEEKNKRREEICLIELAWLNLKAENLAWGYRSPTPPTGFEFSTIYKIWLQLEEIEKVCVRRIQLGLEAQNKNKNCLEKFYKKAELHKMWLLECDQLLEMTRQNDARSIRTNFETLRSTNQISKKLLVQQRALVRSICQRNSAMVADAEAHHYLNLKVLTKIKPRDAIFEQIDKRWCILKQKFLNREDFLKHRLDYVDMLLEIVSVIEEFEMIWEIMQDRSSTESSLIILENRVNSATKKVLKLSPNWNFISKTNAESIVGRLYARFLGLNWTILSAFHSYKRYFAETEKFLSLSRKVCENLATIKDQLEYVDFLSNAIEKASFDPFSSERKDTIISLLSKVNRLIHEVNRQTIEYSISSDLTENDSPKSENRISTVIDAFTKDSHLPQLVRSKSLQIISEAKIDYRPSRIRRNIIIRRIHEEFEFQNLQGLHIVHELKSSLKEKLALHRQEIAEKQAYLFKQSEYLQERLSGLQSVVDLLSSTSAIQVDINKIQEWIGHTLVYFAENPLPDALTDILEGTDKSKELWWEELFHSNIIFLTNLKIQSRINKKLHLILRVDESRSILDEIKRRFLPSNDIAWQQQEEDEGDKKEEQGREEGCCFERISNKIRVTNRKGLEKLKDDLDKIYEEANRRKEELQCVKQNIHAIQTCCRLLDWIQRSEEGLMNIESPFHRLSLKASADLYPSLLNEPFLVALEKEVDFNISASLPVLQDLQSKLLAESPWSGVLEHTFNSWNELINATKMKRLSIDTVQRLLALNNDLLSTRLWIKDKKELLLTIREIKATMGEMIRMECRMANWESDLKALNERIAQVFTESEALKTSLEELESPLSAEADNGASVKEAKDTLRKWTEELKIEWLEFNTLLKDYQKDLEKSLAFQSMLQELEMMNTLLMSKQNTITSLELPTSIAEIDEQKEIFQSIVTDLNASEDKLQEVMEYGLELAANQEKAIASAVIEKLENLNSEWSEVLILCNHQIGSLSRQRSIQEFLRDVDSLNALLSRRENQIVETDYLPTIDCVQEKINIQKQILSLIRGLSNQVKETGTKATIHKFGEKYRAKAVSLANKYRDVESKAATVLNLLEFRLAEKEKMNQLESIEEWILERLAAVNAQFATSETALREQKAIQKYHLFRNFEAEVNSYENLVNETFRSVKLISDRNPNYANCLKETLEKNEALWNELKTTVAVQGSKLIKEYRAIIITEGCEELLEWLQKTAVKIFGLQSCNYLKGDLSLHHKPPLTSQSGSMIQLTSPQLNEDLLSRHRRLSLSQNCVAYLEAGCLDFAENFDPSALNSAISKLNEIKAKMRTKREFLRELEEHCQHLLESKDKFAEHEKMLKQVNSQFQKVESWLSTCFFSISAQRHVINVLRTLADEIQWMEEKQARLDTETTALSLLDVQKLTTRHQNLTNEVKSRHSRNQPLINAAIEWLQLAEFLKVQSFHLQDEKAYCAAFLVAHKGVSEELFAKISELIFRQAIVHRDIEIRRGVLNHWRAWFIQQMDLLELYNWLTETESTVMTESHAARGLASANAAIKKHSVVEAIVSVFQAQRLRLLSTRTTDLLAAIESTIISEQKRLDRCVNAASLFVEIDEASKARAHRHKLRRRIHMLERSSIKLCSTQTSVQKQFTDLRDLVMEKKHRLYELLALNRLYEEVSDVEEWMWSKTEEALVENTGRDLEECARLQREFRETHHSIIREGVTDQRIEECLTSHLPATDFALIGQLPPMSDSPDRLIRTIIVCRQMIKLKHSDSPQIAQWQDRLTEDWGELRELLKTRGELLQAAGNRLLLLNRCEEAIADLNEKMDSFPTVLGADSQSLARQQRQQVNFRQSTIPIGKRVNWVVRASNVLLLLYAQAEAAAIQSQKQKMLEAWDKLNAAIETRTRMLQDAEVLSRWLTWLHHGLSWIISAENLILLAKERENEEIEANCGRAILQYELPRFVNQHKQLWDEICAWESSILFHCEEGATASFNCSLETEDFEVASTFIGIHKMLARSVNQLKSECEECPTNGALASAVQKAVFVVLGEAQPLLPSQVMKNGAALLLIHFYQLKINWWRYWRHLEVLSAKLDILRDLQNLENWIETMEPRVETDDLGESLEETMVLTEEHRKFSRAVASQEEKCRRLAEFEINQLEESDPEWEKGIERQMVENLERLNILPRMPSTPVAVSSESMSLQDDYKPAEELPFERLEGVLYQKFQGQRLSNRGKRSSRWQKCFAVLNPITISLHVLEISGISEIKRTWIAENVEKDGKIPLCRELVTTLVEQKGGDGSVFKIHNLETGDSYVFKAKTRESAEKWVRALNEASSKAPPLEQCEREQLSAKETVTRLASHSLSSAHKSQSTSCLPIRRLITSKRTRHRKHSRYHIRCREISGSSTSSVDPEEVGIRSLSPHSLLSSLGMSAAESGPQSRALVALILPLRVLRRRVMRHTHLASSTSHHSHFSADAVLTGGSSSGGTGAVSSGVGGVLTSDDGDESSIEEESRFATSADDAMSGNEGQEGEEETDIDEVDEFS